MGTQVIVVGAGVTGLSAAYHLAPPRPLFFDYYELAAPESPWLCYNRRAVQRNRLEG